MWGGVSVVCRGAFRLQRELLECLKELLRVESEWVPARDGFSVYLRPAMMATTPSLGVGPPSDALFWCLLSPAGPYFPAGLKPISLAVDTTNVRAFPGGVGDRKVAGNYAPTILPQVLAAARGCSQVHPLAATPPPFKTLLQPQRPWCPGALRHKSNQSSQPCPPPRASVGRGMCPVLRRLKHRLLLSPAPPHLCSPPLQVLYVLKGAPETKGVEAALASGEGEGEGDGEGAVEEGLVGESGAMNVFFLLRRESPAPGKPSMELVTPPLDGLILPGRRSTLWCIAGTPREASHNRGRNPGRTLHR